MSRINEPYIVVDVDLKGSSHDANVKQPETGIDGIVTRFNN
jgi:hypothetical protein